MAKKFIITYDLNNEKGGYAGARKELVNRIEAQFPKNRLVMRSTYVVFSNLNAEQIRDKLLPLIDLDDRLFVADFDDWAGFVETDVSDWINENS